MSAPHASIHDLAAQKLAEMLFGLVKLSSPRAHLAGARTLAGEITEAMVLAHVTGSGPRLGLIPFMTDAEVRWVVIDLDALKWSLDPDAPEVFAIIHAIVESLALLGITAWLERSRSKGWHLWVLFDAPVRAADVRALLVPLAVRAGAKEASDLVCPRQADRSETEKGLGNGVYMPLFGADREPFTRFYQLDAESGDWLVAENQAAVLRQMLEGPSPASAVPVAERDGDHGQDRHDDGDADQGGEYQRRPWTGEVPPRVTALLQNDGEIALRFERDTAGGKLAYDDETPDNSKIDASLASLLFHRLEGAEDWEVEHTLRASHARAGIRDSKYDRRYFEREVKYARKSWEETQKKREQRTASSHREKPLHAEAPWPDPLAEAAFLGVMGDLVRLIEPHTEADPAALLLDGLAQFGSMIGRHRYFTAEADQHFANVFALVVGKTSKARKGVSHGHVRLRVGSVDEAWQKSCNVSGLSSGEGLIWQVRDPIYKSEKVSEKGEPVEYGDVLVDEGVADKRLFVFQSEFGSVLSMLAREGNTLSAIIRDAWDRGHLCALTKNSQAKATGAHISVFGHITAEELRRNLSRTEVANGFANRFLLACARRARVLPEGGQLDSVDFGPVEKRLKDALLHGQKAGEMSRDEAARGLWREVYEDLSEGKPGLLGAVTSRAEAQVMRLALIYAVLGQANKIGLPHLEAALAVWRYCEASARYAFGDGLGDPVADEILRALRATPEGLTRTQIRDLFGRNKAGDQIGRALATLASLGLAEMRPEKKTGPGRTAERWVAK